MAYRLASENALYKDAAFAGRNLVLPHDRVIRLGRGREADYQLLDNRISRIHCKIEFVEGHPTIEDLGSANGTYVNGRAEKSKVLRNGDKVLIGNSLLRVERIPDEAGAAAKPVPAAGAKAAAAPLAPAPVVPVVRSARPTPKTFEVHLQQDKSSTAVLASVGLCPTCQRVFQKTKAGVPYCPNCADVLLGQTLGGYKLLERVAVTDVCTVYRAEGARSKRAHAVKVLLPSLAGNPKAIERFARLRAGGLELAHPNQVKTCATPPSEEHTFIAMEFAPGETAEALIAREGFVDAKIALRIGLQVAAALVAAEGKGLAHGELYPGHVLVDKDQGARVIGLGAVPWSESAARQDLASLAAVIVYLLCGRVPLPAASGAAASVRELIPSESAELIEALERLRVAPPQGYVSALDFMLDILPVLARRKGRAALPGSLRDLAGLRRLISWGGGTLSEARLAGVFAGKLAAQGLPAVGGYAVEAAACPRASVPQAFHDVIPRPDGTVAFVFAGEIAQGVAGTFMLLLLHAAFRTLAREPLSPSQVLVHASALLGGGAGDEVRVPALLAILDPADHTLTFAQAGGLGPILWNKRQGRHQPMATEGDLLGTPDFHPPEEQVLPLAPGNRLLFLTPGTAMAATGQMEELAVEGVLQAQGRVAGPVQAQLDAFVAALQARFGAALPVTDLALLAVERTAPAAVAEG